jgi:hypothetical protein
VSRERECLTVAKVLEARAKKSPRVVISRDMARWLAALCKDLAWQENTAEVPR